ncbi:M6 family metalloprotease domain-containing protein [Streptomyces cinerochromogenes]|uniref:M6 family metalloprotease domain-containing protein n=1 Tax=Streptomyces cinerochromogenes TaxID=66422 RepID=A0ABW7BBT5_9ACTN
MSETRVPREGTPAKAGTDGRDRLPGEVRNIPRFRLPRTRRPFPLLVLWALTVLLALTAVPAQHAHAVNGSTSPCALQGWGTTVNEGQNTDYTQFLNPLGIKNVGVVYVDFPDVAGAGDVADYYNLLSPAADWVWNASYGKTGLSMRPMVNRWVRMPSASNAYGTSSPTYQQHTRYVTDALRAAADAGADLARYDLFYIVSTAHSQVSGSHTWYWTPTQPIVIKGTTVRWAVTFGTDMWHWGYKVAAHETAHVFGAPDLYAFSGDQHRYVGGWDVMGHIAGAAPQYFGWLSWKFGWTGDDQVVCVWQNRTQNTATLNGVEYVGGTKLLAVKTGTTTAYVAEARRKAHNDSGACSSGVVIYKVDTSVASGQGPVRVVPNPNAAAPPAGCGTLDMATWQPGQTFYDRAAGVQFTVRSADAYNSTVNAIKW